MPSSAPPAHRIRRSLRLMTGAIARLGFPTLSTPIIRPVITGAAIYITELFHRSDRCAYCARRTRAVSQTSFQRE
jgi:hypothetical protein